MSVISWSVVSAWNDSLGTRPDRPMVPRNYMWASELGKSKIDRYLSMTAVVPTNSPDIRSRRKFDVGNFLESHIAFVLMRAGVLLSDPIKQDRVTFQYPGLLEVSGRPDFIVGGVPNWDRAKELIENDQLTEGVKYQAIEMIRHLKETYPPGTELKKMVLELKSASLFMFNQRERERAADPHHVLQAYHYLKSLNIDEAKIVYLCKDDSRTLEFSVYLNSSVENIYRQDIAEMTEIIRSGKRPEKEPEIILDMKKAHFSDNWKITYSPYLTMLYPKYKHGEEYRNTWKSLTASWNRVLGRYIRGERMTDKNLEAIESVKVFFPNAMELFEQMKMSVDPASLEGIEIE